MNWCDRKTWLSLFQIMECCWYWFQNETGWFDNGCSWCINEMISTDICSSKVRQNYLDQSFNRTLTKMSNGCLLTHPLVKINFSRYFSLTDVLDHNHILLRSWSKLSFHTRVFSVFLRLLFLRVRITRAKIYSCGVFLKRTIKISYALSQTHIIPFFQAILENCELLPLIP